MNQRGQKSKGSDSIDFGTFELCEEGLIRRRFAPPPPFGAHCVRPKCSPRFALTFCRTSFVRTSSGDMTFRAGLKLLSSGGSLCVLSIFGAPEEIRTPDPLVRSQILYPTELRART